MKLVLLSGGSGKRLWPLSNDFRSKQFLKVLQKDDESSLESMVQRVWRQLSEVGMANSTYLATGKGQKELLQSQLGYDAPIIIEPERRDTFPAIALSAAYLSSVESVPLNEVVGVLPVDPFVETRFFNRVMDLENALNKSDADLALLGVKPTFPSSKYGYIVPELTSANEQYISVSHFKEKPDESTAKLLIKENALWNCGVFAFKLGFIIDILKEKGISANYEELKNNYNLLEKISFDYAVVEKTKNRIALSYDGFWKDLGTWNTLTEEMSAHQIGLGTLSEDSKNTHVVNELDIPINVLGLANIVVAASPDGILVSDKQASPRVKEILDNQNERPMYEERRWGSYKVLDFTKFIDQREVLTKKILIKKGESISYHYHNHREETWTVINGNGLIALDGQILSIKPGDFIKINKHQLHSINAIEDLEIIEVQSGLTVSEEDIKRICFKWEEVVKMCEIKSPF